MGSTSQFQNDIFLTYSHYDDVSLLGGRGWVGTIHERLAIRLPQLSGHMHSILTDSQIPGNESLTNSLALALQNTALLVVVLTPSYLRSAWCRMELEEFYRRASIRGGFMIQGRARIFKVLKVPIAYDEQPPELRDLPSYDFFEVDRETGMVTEFSPELGGYSEIRYWDIFDQLSRDIEAFLENARHVTTSPPLLSTKRSLDCEVVEKPGISRLLRVFLCHASDDKPSVRVLYRRLRADSVDAWLDEENLLPGQDWQREIPRAVRQSDAAIVCLSERSVSKAGFIQKEIKYALDVADEQPEDVIFLIPLRFQECQVPSRLERFHWVDYFRKQGHDRLMRALRARSTALSVLASEGTPNLE